MVDVITICGRWNGHLMYADYMADVVAISDRLNSHFCQMQPIWQMWWPKWHRWNSHLRVVGALADGKANCQLYSNLSSEMLCRTSSHMCGRWYLPMFLFRDGLLTLIYRALFNCSQEVLILSSLYAKVVNSDTMTRDDRMVMDRGRGLKMFLEPLCKISCWLTNILFITFHPVALVCIWPHSSSVMVSLSLGAIRWFVMVSTPGQGGVEQAMFRAPFSSPFLMPGRWTVWSLKGLLSPSDSCQTPPLLHFSGEWPYGLSCLCAGLWLWLPVYPHLSLHHAPKRWDEGWLVACAMTV